jgi:hypothetical protein
VSKADLNEEGRRFTTEQDKDTLRAIRKQSAEYLRRVATHIQQEGKATPPVKKAAPAAPELPDATKAEIKKLRDHARVTRELAGMRLANNPAGSFHHNRGLQDEKDADRFDAEADALERGGTSAPEAPTAPKVAGPPVRRIHQTEYTPEGKLRLRERPNADEPVYLPNRGNDQGLVHLDSELGELWQDLYRDDREPNSFINEIAHLGEDVGTGKLPLAQALTRLAGMKGRATDPAVADRIQAAIDAMDAPPVELPELPDTVPDAIRRALRRLADIPTARIKGGRMVGLKHRDTSILEDKIDVVRRIDSGEIRRGPEMELMNRDSHESGDGALEMWRIFERLTAPEWVVGYDDQRKPIMEPNPEWPEIQAWLRGARERASARQRS